METVLIIEDDHAILTGLEKNLRFEGYEVLTASDGERGLELAVNKKPDLIVLDIMLPKLNGFEICKTIDRLEIDVPIIILSAKDQEIDKIMGLDLGADDYLTKPFSIRELIARIGAILRRSRRNAKVTEPLRFGEVIIDLEAQEVTRSGQPVEMSTREFNLLAFLVKNAGKVLERQQILNCVWGYDYFGTARTIDNFVTKLRQKLEANPNKPEHILTVRGVGYKFQE